MRTNYSILSKSSIRFLYLFIVGLLLSNFANAQIYDSDVHYYIKAGDDMNSSTIVKIIKYNGSELKYTSAKLSDFLSKIGRNEDYYEDYLLNKGGKYKYNSSISTSSREVYEQKREGETQQRHTGQYNYVNLGMGITMPSEIIVFEKPLFGYNYYGVSPNADTIVYWQEDKNRSNVTNKTYWKEVQLEDLKPKAANRDFLYE